MGHIPFLPLLTVIVRLSVDLSASRLHMSTGLKERWRELTRFVGGWECHTGSVTFMGGQ